MTESDSEDDVFTNTKRGFQFENDTMILSARGPNTGVMSFRSNVSSSMQMPRSFERYRYAGSNYDQRSMNYERRETSPMSIMSACDVRQRNFNKSYYPRAMSSQRSAFNGRSGSPMSVRSIDSSASVSAADIAMAFKSANYNKHEMRVIKEAYNKFMRHRVRKKIEKRKNLKQFLKGCRRIPGGVSGDEGSDSSLSSDDRSTRTSNYKDNMSSCRSTKTDISNLRRTIKESNMYIDCTDNFKNDSFRSKFAGQGNPDTTQSYISSSKSMFAGSTMSKPMPKDDNLQKKPSLSTVLQKDRFQNGFMLPSQRFNRSIAATSIPEITENDNHRHHIQNGKNTNIEIDSDQDDIFSGPIEQKNKDVQRKRSIEREDDIISLPTQKRSKLVSPIKNSKEVRKQIPKESSMHTENNVNFNDKSNDFVFAKPTFPVRKTTKEKLLAKCNGPLLDTVVQQSNITTHNRILQPENPQENIEEDQTNVTQSITDLSSRPSFIKRKLFTQKLDVSEKKNTSTDSSNSPQNSIYDAIQKEKHKARKLQQVTTQSCLSRDIQDESNLLDLIHKIVPNYQMNVTNQTNKTDLQSSKNKTDHTEKWDVSSIISERKEEDDVSDTYTDEEIFNATVKEMAKENNKCCNKLQKVNTPKRTKEFMKENKRMMEAKKMQVKATSPIKRKACKVLVEKLPPSVTSMSNQAVNVDTNDMVHKKIQRGVKLFWDTTDAESEAECQPTPRKNASFKEYHLETQQTKEAPIFQGLGNKFSSKKTATSSNVSTFISNTTDIIHKFGTTTLRIRSHRNPVRKNLDHTRVENTNSILIEPQSKKHKPVHAKNCIALGKNDPKPIINTEKQMSNDSLTEPTKPDNKKRSNNKTQSSKTKPENNKESPKKRTPIKQSKRTNKQIKAAESGPKVNKENIESKDNMKKDNNKQKKTSQKTNNEKLGSASIIEEKKSRTKKTTPNKINSKNNDQDPIKNKPEATGKSNKKTKLSPDTSIEKQTKTNKKTATTKSRNKKQSPKTKSTEKTTLNHDYSSNDTFDKENNLTHNRTLRSCRLAKLSPHTTLNETNRTLRSRQIDLSSSTININRTKSKPNNDTPKTELSDLSFSLTKKKTVARRAASRFLQTNDAESSDVSFSLRSIKTPNTNASAKLNSKASKRQLNVSKTFNNNSLKSNVMSEPKNDINSHRNRVPNKRYLNI